MYFEIIITTLAALLMLLVIGRFKLNKTSQKALFNDGPTDIHTPSSETQMPTIKQQKMIDEDILGKLAAEVSPKLFPTLLDVFVKEIVTRCNAIDTLPHDGSDPRLKIEIHSLKSCARTFGAIDFAEQAATIEQIICGHPGNIEQQLLQLQNMLPMVLGEFSAFQAQLSNKAVEQ